MKTRLAAALLVVVGLTTIPGIAQDGLTLVGQYPEDPPYPSLNETAIQGDSADIATGGGLQIYDISDPSAPTEAGYCDIHGAAGAGRERVSGGN